MQFLTSLPKILRRPRARISCVRMRMYAQTFMNFFFGTSLLSHELKFQISLKIKPLLRRYLQNNIALATNNFICFCIFWCYFYHYTSNLSHFSIFCILSISYLESVFCIIRHFIPLKIPLR